MELHNNYLSRKKKYSYDKSLGYDIPKLIVSPNDFVSITDAARLAGGDYTVLLQIAPKFFDYMKDWVNNAGEIYKRVIKGDWSDIRTSWEQAMRPTFMPDSMTPEAVVTTALAQASQVSDMCQKAGYTMKGANVKAWFFPWVFYFPNPVTKDQANYEAWATMESFGNGAEIKQFGKIRGCWDYSGATDLIVNGGPGWCVFYYAVYELDFSQRDKIFDIIKRKNFGTLFQIREAAKTQAASDNDPLAIPSEWGLEYVGRDFEHATIDKNYCYWYGNKNNMQAGVEGEVVLYNSGNADLQIGSQLMFDIFNFGNDPQKGVPKGLYRKKSNFLPPVGFKPIAIARGGQGFTPEKNYKYAFGTDTNWTIVTSEQLTNYIGKPLLMDKLPQDVYNLFAPSGDIKPNYYKYLYAKKHTAVKYESAALGNFGNAAKVKNILKNS